MKLGSRFQVNLSFDNQQAHHTKPCHSMPAPPSLGLSCFVLAGRVSERAHVCG